MHRQPQPVCASHLKPWQNTQPQPRIAKGSPSPAWRNPTVPTPCTLPNRVIAPTPQAPLLNTPYTPKKTHNLSQIAHTLHSSPSHPHPYHLFIFHLQHTSATMSTTRYLCDCLSEYYTVLVLSIAGAASRFETSILGIPHPLRYFTKDADPGLEWTQAS